MAEDGVDEAAQRFGGGFAGGQRAGDEVDELGLAEELTGAGAGFSDAVGVDQNPVAGFELCLVHGAGGLVGGAEAERQLVVRRLPRCGHSTMDLDGPRKGVLVGRKSPYPVEFRNDAVALFRAAGGRRTYAAVAADVGVTGETLRSWVRQADEQAGRASNGEATSESRDEELARLRAENGRLRKAEIPNVAVKSHG